MKNRAVLLALLVSITPYFLTSEVAQAAAVAVDSVAPSATGIAISSGSTLSWSHTVGAGSDTLLTAGVAVGVNPDTRTVSVTYAGVPMISAGKVHSNNQIQGFVELFYLKGPATGTNTVQVTLTGGNATMEAGSVSFTGVDQTTPVRNIVTGAGTGVSPRLTIASAPGNMVVNAFVNGCDGGTTSINTLRWVREVNCSTAGGNGAQSTAPGAASVVMGYTVPSDWWGMVGMDVVASGVPSEPDVIAPSTPTNLQASAVSTSQINLSWNASTDNVGVSGYKIFRNSVQVATSTLTDYSDTGLTPATTYSYAVSAHDAAGNVSGQTLPVFATTLAPVSDITPPTVSISLPINGTTLGGTVTVSANASDNVSVVGVQFLLDGANLGAEDATAPYSVSWNTTSASSGAHTLIAVARDAANNTATSSSISVTVDNNFVATNITDFVDMENGPDGSLVTPTIAANDSTGNSGNWVNGPGGAPTQMFVSKSSGLVTPPRGPVQVGGNTIVDNGSTGLYRKHLTNDYDTVSYDLTSPASKMSAGLYMYFSGAALEQAIGRYYDVFDFIAQNGDYIVFSLISGSPLTFQVHTTACGSGVPIMNGQIGKWYWVGLYWDQAAGKAWMKVYDPTDWTLLGSGSCGASNSPIVSLHLGEIDEHGNPAIDADYYMDDLMVDTAGVYSATNPLLPAASGLVTPDTTSPSTPTNLVATSVSTSQINLAWTASTDNVGVAGYKVFRDGNQIATSTTNSFSNTGLTASTTYTYEVTAFDAAGNVSATSASASATTQAPGAGDTTLPTVSLSAPVNGAVATGTARTVSATASDNVGVVGVQFLLDGANLGTEDTASPYSIVWNTTLTSNGAHTLSARTRDAAGNLGFSANVNVIVDNEAPTGSVVINGGVSATKSRSSTLTLSASDGQTSVTHMRFSNSGTSFSAQEAYATTKAWQLSSGNGTKTVYVQFRDAGGKWSSSFTDTIVYDTAAPTISAVAKSNITNDSATITWTTNEPSTSQVNYGLTTSYGSTTTLDSAFVTSHVVQLTGLSSQTTYNFRVRSTDAAGNLRVSTNNTLVTLAGPVDSIAPSIPTDLLANPVSSSQVNLSWTASTDNVAVTGYKVFRNGAQIATTSSTSYSNVNLVPNTTYDYTVSAYDAANNNSAQTAPTSTTTLPDTVSPSVAITAPANNATVVGTSVAITATSSDNVAVVGVTFFVDDVAAGLEDQSAPYSATASNLSVGQHVLKAVARDTAGNTATSSEILVTIIESSGQTITLVNHSQSLSCASATTCVVNLSGPTTAGNLLVITAWANNPVYVTGLNAGGAYSDGYVRNGAPFGDTRGFLSGGYVSSALATAGPVTVTFSGATGGAQVNIREYNATGGTLALDAVGDNLRVNTTSNPYTGPTLELSGTNDVVVAWAGMNTSVASVAAPYGNADFSNTQTGSATADLLNTTSGTPAVWTGSGSPDSAAAAAMAFGFSPIPCTNTAMMDSSGGTDDAPVTVASLNTSTFGTAYNGNGVENWKWETNYNNGAFTWSSSAHKPLNTPMRFCVGGKTYQDTNNLGVQYNTSAGAFQYLEMYFPTQDYPGAGVSNSASIGGWFSTSLPQNSNVNADFFTMQGTQGGFINLIIWGNGTNLILQCEQVGRRCGDGFPIESNKWYWLTLQYNAGGVHHGAVYDESMNLVGNFDAPNSDSPPGMMFFGYSNTGTIPPNATMKFDKLKIRYLGDSEYPLMP